MRGPYPLTIVRAAKDKAIINDCPAEVVGLLRHAWGSASPERIGHQASPEKGDREARVIAAEMDDPLVVMQCYKLVISSQRGPANGPRGQFLPQEGELVLDVPHSRSRQPLFLQLIHIAFDPVKFLQDKLPSALSWALLALVISSRVELVSCPAW